MPRGLPKSYIKKYGISKKAWREYRKAHKKGSRKAGTSSKKKTKRRSRSMPKKKVSRRPKLFRTMGLKGLLIAVAGLTGIKYLIRNYLPQAAGYENSISLLGVGLVKRSVMPAGIAMLASDLITDAITPKGAFTLPQFAGQPAKGYDI